MARRYHRGGSPPRVETVEVVQGLRAGLASMAKRGDDVVRVAFVAGLRKELAEPVRWAIKRGLPCREVDESELSRLAESTHHEGLCVVMRSRKWHSPGALADVLARDGGVAVALDRIRNPYNVGAILRSAAFFAAKGALLGALAPHPGLSPIAVRVAEGGVEHLMLARSTDLAETLARLRACSAVVVGTDRRAQMPAEQLPIGRRPVILVMGNEREGLGERVRAQCDTLVGIPGGGAIESLNVAVAAGILLHLLQRNANDVA